MSQAPPPAATEENKEEVKEELEPKHKVCYDKIEISLAIKILIGIAGLLMIAILMEAFAYSDNGYHTMALIQASKLIPNILLLCIGY